MRRPPSNDKIDPTNEMDSSTHVPGPSAGGEADDACKRRGVWLLDDNADDAELVRHALGSVGIQVRHFDLPSEFLAAAAREEPGCALVDLRLPEMSGIEVVRRLRKLHGSVPVVMLSGLAQTIAVVEAMRLGSVDFLDKPCDPQRLIDIVQRELLASRAPAGAVPKATTDVGQLTPIQLKIVELIATGLSSKQVAAQLNLSKRTIDYHRAKALRASGAPNIAALIRELERRPKS